jgi:hypothetical protein
MQWDEARRRYPRQWLLVEAIAAHSSAGQRILDDISVVEPYVDAARALEGYKVLHHREPQRELYVLHTDRKTLDIGEINWLGIRQAS